VLSLDTNVVVRLLVDDDAEQRASAVRVWREALASGGIFLPTVVLVEVAWVVRASYGFDRATIAQALRRLIDTEGVVVDRVGSVRRALDGFESGAADFSDYVLLESSRLGGALPVITFDQRFAREADVMLVPRFLAEP
jgi:predicted nucleic-acid-binding protein